MHQNPIRDIPHYLRVYQSYLGARMYLVFALTLAAVFAEGLGLLMLLPLLQGMDTGAAADAEPTNGIGKLLHDMLAGFGWADSTVAIILIITIAFIVKGSLLFGANAFNAVLRAQLLRELKGRLFDDYSRMSYRYYAERDTGYFINVINTQITQMLNSFRSLMQLGSQLVSAVIYIGLAFVVTWRFGLMALLIGLVLLFLFRWLSIYVRKLSRRSATENGHLSKLLIQFLNAFKYLTATGQAAHVRTTVMASIRRLTEYEMRRGIAESFTTAVREPITVVFIMLIVLVQMVALGQPLAPILVSILLFYRGLNTILSLQSSWLAALGQIGSLEMVRDEFAAQRRHKEPNSSRTLSDLSQGISLRNLHFSYAPELAPVLSNISLDIPVKTSVALVGESGAGKSTIVDLLTLMLKPDQGQVLIDSVPGDQVELSSWRRQIGYVSQETVIFDDTIANNICMWDGDTSTDSALLERVRSAARQAYIADFVESLTEGYQTLVGDRGVRLSGGQRQRLFIARELFREPNLLILDEATSALDTESERYIQESIDQLKGRITVIIIAHRLSTIRNVDYVYLFDRGRLVEHGPYQELRDTEDSRFGRLVALQSLY
ncbi:ABC transporter ATP-binding protein [Thiocapsa rosea]|uniref:Multidrug resistance-like ATP-binding protein MdlB n=1 Tax=Thiocapsa rosea TaxID=69360 RepID=A0A495V8D2_9GAMM|nr:ABC transporter ATP-binding protein [Thiocapsa rosea]RKT45544.1 ABC-type bacteriocin/lantibiotic exporter with double-glycine peptidase domain [Thiocapsa rosea]